MHATPKKKSRQGRQCTYKVTLRRVRATNVAVEKQNVLHILSVSWYSCISYPAFNVHASYCHLWPVWLCNIFPHYLIKGTIKKKKVIEHKIRVLMFPTISCRNISHSKKNRARYKRCKLVFT